MLLTIFPFPLYFFIPFNSTCNLKDVDVADISHTCFNKTNVPRVSGFPKFSPGFYEYHTILKSSSVDMIFGGYDSQHNYAKINRIWPKGGLRCDEISVLPTHH